MVFRASGTSYAAATVDSKRLFNLANLRLKMFRIWEIVDRGSEA